MAPPPDLPPSGSIKARLASLNQASSSSSSSREYTGGSLKDKIARYDVQGAPLVPKSAFGTGLGVEGGREAGRGQLVGNRIPSAGRGGFGVTPGSSSRSSSQARSISNSSSHAVPPSSSTMGNNSGPFSTGRQSPALRSSMESSSNNSNEGGPRSTGELSPITSPSPSPSSPAPNTTNALPPSFLAATLPGAPRGDGDDGTISRSPSVLVNPPGSTTSLSSLTSDVSVASSYAIEPQQPPYTEVQAAEDEGDATEDDEDRGIFVGGGKGPHHLGGFRSSSPVGSLFVEPGSKAPSTIGDEDEHEPREVNDAPLTPRAEHFRELSLEDSVGDTTLQDGLDEDFKTPPAAADEEQHPPFSLVGLQLDPEEEPDVEDAEMVPVLEEKEREMFEEQLEELNNGSPQVEIGGEAAVEAKVETWAEEVAEAAETKEKVEEVEPEAVVVEAEEEEVREPETTPAEVQQLDEGEPTPPAPTSSLPDLTSSTTAEISPSIDVQPSPEEIQQVVEVSQAPLEGEVKSIAPADEFVAAPSPVQESAIPIAVAAAFEQEKRDRGVSEDDEKPSHPTSDFVAVKDEPTEEEKDASTSCSDAPKPELHLHSPTPLDVDPSPPSTPASPHISSSNVPEDPTSDDELSSPIPGSFPGSPTHSSFARSPSRSSSLARASFTLEDLEIDQESSSQDPASTSSGLDVELVNEASPQPSPALDMSFISSFPSVPTSSSSTTPQPSSDPTEERPSTPPPPSSIPFPHSKTPEHDSEIKRSPSTRSNKPTKSPLELDSDDEDIAAEEDGVKVTFISRERYS